MFVASSLDLNYFLSHFADLVIFVLKWNAHSQYCE